MRIAIIGAGHVGTTLGKGWASAGHEIVYGVRDGGDVAAHAGAKKATVGAAAAAGEVVVLATPWAAVEDALTSAGDLGGKPLLDATNPIGEGFALTLGHVTSGAERVAAIAKNARVVKAFNTTGFENVADPKYGASRLAMPIAGDDRGAVDVAARLAADLGFEPVPLAALSRARELEPLAMLWIKLAVAWGQGRSIGYALSRRSAEQAVPTLEPVKRARPVTIVGSGNIGGALARAWLKVGHRVRIATRDASANDVQELVALGAKAVPVAGAANGAEVVVFAIPAGAVVETAQAMGDVAGKVVVDCTNAIGKGFTLVHGYSTSSAEELAKALPGARVVRSFNQQGAEVLRNPLFGETRATNFVASDDADARALVLELSSQVGLDSVGAGPLSSARYLEPITLLWVAMAQALGTRELGLSLLRR